jgi:hypothetical protein
MNKIEKYCLNIAGEFSVCAELAKRNLIPTITLGNYKSVDIVVNDPMHDKSALIEVKCTNKKRFVTGFFQKYKTQQSKGPDFWVLVDVSKIDDTRFFIFTHLEIAKTQMRRNGMESWSHVAGGVDNLPLGNILDYENQWEKVTDFFLEKTSSNS